MRCLAVCCLPAALACTHTIDQPDGSGGFGAIGGLGAQDGVGGASTIGTGGTPIIIGAGGSFGGGGFGGCSPPDLYGLELRNHYVDPYQPREKTLYAWISVDEEMELRSGTDLLPPEKIEGRTRPFSVEQLSAWAIGHPDSLEAAIMPGFENARSAWSHPWPIVFSPAGEDAGPRLLKMELSTDAWVARVAEHGAIWEVYDLEGYVMPLEVVRETPERIGLLFFVHLGEQGNASCGAQEQIVTGPGYREFVVGNPEMLVSYEVGTEAVLQELGSNISALSEYMDHTRPCPTTLFEPFESSLVCSWGYSGDPFVDALTNAAPLYRPTAANLADLIERLEDSLFDVDPFVSSKE